MRPGEKQTPTPTVEFLRKDIEYLESRLPSERLMSKAYREARQEGSEWAIPAMDYGRYAGAEGNVIRIEKELEEKRRQLEELLSGQSAINAA